MQFTDIILRAAFLAKQAGWDEAAPAPDWKALVNRGLQDFSWDSEYNEEEAQVTSVINQATYPIDTAALPRSFKSFRSVAYATQTTTPKDLKLSSEGDESSYDPLWWQKPAGSPVRFLIPGPNLIRIYPPCINGGDTITIRGTREAVPMSADTDVPGFPGTWHEAIALRAAVLYCEPWVDENGAAKIQLYREQYAGQVKACIEFISTNRYPRLQRRVSSPSRRRTYLRQSGRY